MWPKSLYEGVYSYWVENGIDVTYHWSAELAPLHETSVADCSTTVWRLYAAVAIAFLIGVVNVSGLFLGSRAQAIGVTFATEV